LTTPVGRGVPLLTGAVYLVDILLSACASKNIGQGLAKLQVFAPHLVSSEVLSTTQPRLHIYIGDWLSGRNRFHTELVQTPNVCGVRIPQMISAPKRAA
jgi:hypothetical protein